MVSVIVCSITPARFGLLRANLRQLLGAEPHEFIGIHDAKSMAEGYNRGLRQSKGDRVILCHDDIEILAPDFGKLLISRLEQFDMIGVAGSSRLSGPIWFQAGPPYVFGQVAHYLPNEQCYDVSVWSVPASCVPGICVLDGLFMAARRDVLEKIPFDEQTFDGFHLYDMDHTLRASQAGFKIGVCTDFMVVHASQGMYDQTWQRHAERFTAKHRQSFKPGPSLQWNAMSIKVRTRQDLCAVLRRPEFQQS